MQRIDVSRVAPDVLAALRSLQQTATGSGLPRQLLELLRIRASQINGCAYCLDMHTKDARAAGETEQRLYLLNAWRESPCYSAAERAALEWTEAVTMISDGHAPDAAYMALLEYFTERQIVDLTVTIVAINSWNRLLISARREAGGYVSRLAPQATTEVR